MKKLNATIHTVNIPLANFLAAFAIGAAFVFPICAHGQFATSQPPPVPPQYSGLFALMHQDLDAFTNTIEAGWNGSKPHMQLAAELYPATSVSAPPAYFLQRSVIPYLNALQALGVKTVKFSINFPVLYQPFYNSPAGANNPAGYLHSDTCFLPAARC